MSALAVAGVVLATILLARGALDDWERMVVASLLGLLALFAVSDEIDGAGRRGR